MVIGKLNVLLGLNSAEFSTGMQKAGNHVRTFKTTVSATSNALMRVGLAAQGVRAIFDGLSVAVRAVAGPFRMLAAEMERIDQIVKASQKLGMAPEALIGLQHAAGLAGVEIDALETGLAQMSKRVAEAAQGAGAARDALAELAIDPSTLMAMSPEQQFLRIADALANVGSQADRVRLTFALFGRGGVDLLGLLQEGSDAIRAAMQDAEKLGMTFSSIDAAQVERANDSMERLRVATNRLKQVLAIELAPTIEVVSNLITDWLTDSETGLSRFDASMTSIVSTIQAAADGFRQLAILYNKFLSGALQIHYRLIELAELWGKQNNAVKSLFGAAGFAIPEIKFPTPAAREAYFDTLLEEIARLEERARELGREDWGESIADRIREIKAEIAAAAAAGRPEGSGLLDPEAMEEQQRKMDELRRKGEALAGSLRTPYEVLADRIKDANILLKVGAINWQTYGREIAAVREEMLKLQKVVELPTLVERGSQADYASAAGWEQRNRLPEIPIDIGPPSLPNDVTENTWPGGRPPAQVELNSRLLQHLEELNRTAISAVERAAASPAPVQPDAILVEPPMVQPNIIVEPAPVQPDTVVVQPATIAIMPSTAPVDTRTADTAGSMAWRDSRPDRPALPGRADREPAIGTPEVLRALDGIKTVLVEVKEHGRSTSASSRRTATATERAEKPVLVDM